MFMCRRDYFQCTRKVVPLATHTIRIQLSSQVSVCLGVSPLSSHYLLFLVLIYMYLISCFPNCDSGTLPSFPQPHHKNFLAFCQITCKYKEGPSVSCPPALPLSLSFPSCRYTDPPLKPQIERWLVLSWPHPDWMLYIYCGHTPTGPYAGKWDLWLWRPKRMLV